MFNSIINSKITFVYSVENVLLYKKYFLFKYYNLEMFVYTKANVYFVERKLIFFCDNQKI